MWFIPKAQNKTFNVLLLNFIVIIFIKCYYGHCDRLFLHWQWLVRDRKYQNRTKQTKTFSEHGRFISKQSMDEELILIYALVFRKTWTRKARTSMRKIWLLKA